MKIVVENDKIVEADDIVANSGSIRYYTIDLTFNEVWNDLIKKAILVNTNTLEAYEFAIIDNKIYLDVNKNGVYSIGFVGYNIENEKNTYQISTNLINITIKTGAGEITLIEHKIPTLSEWEIYIKQIEDLVDGAVIIGITETVDGLVHTYTIEFSNGNTYPIVVKDGEKGDKRR